MLRVHSETKTDPASLHVDPGPSEPRLRSPGRRAVAIVADHRLFATLLAIATILRVIATLAYRPALLFYGDSFEYLRISHELRPDSFRPIGYPLFLRAFLPDSHVAVIPILQHLMGIASGVAIYWLLRRIGIGKVGATIAAAPILLDAYVLNLEQYLVTEPLFIFLTVGAMVVLVRRAQPSVGAAFLAGLLLSLGSLTRFAGIPLILPAVLYVVRRRDLRRSLLAAGVMVLAFAAPLFGYASWFGHSHGRFALAGYPGLTLYSRVAPFADCSTFEVEPSMKVLCEVRPPSQRPGQNFYAWHKDSPANLLKLPKARWDDVLKDFSNRAIDAQPLDYAATVGRDFIHYFAPGRSTTKRDQAVETWQFSTDLYDRERVAKTVRRFSSHDLSVPRISAPLARVLSGYQGFAFMPGPLLAAALVLGAAGIVGIRGAGRGLGREAFLFTATGFLVLAMPLLRASFDYRYLVPAATLLAPAGVIGATVLLRRRRAARRVEAL